MKHFARKAAMALCVVGLAGQAFAGNKDRTGQAGASELLINPWGRSTGVFGMDGAHTAGLEAMRVNIAGLAASEKLEVNLSYNKFFSGANMGVTDAGLAFKVGKSGTFGANVMSFNFGEIAITDFNNPSGGIGTYTPQFYNISVGYSQEFANKVRAGISATFINEQISNVGATGACFDAGVQYTTGKKDNFHFGVVLRNLGFNMRFRGQGFAINGEAPEDETYVMQRETPQDKFQMPTYLNIALSYDFYLDENRMKPGQEKPIHRLSPMASFTSNSFLNDYIGAGAEYAFKETFMLRAGYRYEKDIMTNSFYTGVAAGASVKAPLGKGEKAPSVTFDYSYRPTQRPANGVHAVSMRFALR